MYTGENGSIAEKQRQKQSKAEKISWDKHFKAISGTTFRICKCFKRSKQKLYIYFDI
jgi:hypothetical protein